MSKIGDYILEKQESGELPDFSNDEEYYGHRNRQAYPNTNTSTQQEKRTRKPSIKQDGDRR